MKGSKEESLTNGDVEKLISSARQDRMKLGRLLETVRQYLLGIANEEIQADLRTKVAASDIVQETLMEALQDFERFAGQDEVQLKAWLRQILRNNVLNCNRQYRNAQKRDIGKEVSLEGVGGSSRLQMTLADFRSLPPISVSHNEDLELLDKAMATLSEDQALVIKLRNWDLLTFEKIGEQMQRSPDATRMHWVRSMESLSKALRKIHGR